MLGLVFFFFNDPATTEIYTLSLHDALPIWIKAEIVKAPDGQPKANLWASIGPDRDGGIVLSGDRKSTRLNSSHMSISYAVFCLKKKKTRTSQTCTINISHSHERVS